jgi:hypothetical protein
MKELIQLLAAQEAAYQALVRALHEKGVLPIDAVIEKLEGSQAFAKAAHDKQTNPAESQLLDRLKALAAAYREFQPPASPSGDADR